MVSVIILRPIGRVRVGTRMMLPRTLAELYRRAGIVKVINTSSPVETR